MDLRGRVLAAGVVALLSACTSSSPEAAPSPAAPSVAPSAAASTPADVVAACTHVRTAFEQQAARNWGTVLAALGAAWQAGHAANDRQFVALIPPPGSLRLDDTQRLGEVTDTLAFACGLPSRPRPGSSPAAPSRREVMVSFTAVDGVRVGTPADEAERRLRQSLGDADSHDLPGCNGESGRRLTWGSFDVVLSNDGKGPPVLLGWALRRGVSRVSYRLPYDIQPGDAVRDAMTRVPGAVGVAGEGETEGRYVISTDRRPDVLWISDQKGRTGKVEEVTFRDPSCD
jgi:hypothetical protein